MSLGRKRGKKTWAVTREMSKKEKEKMKLK